MSKNINVNPDHYKTAGRERQGEDVVPELEKAKLKAGGGLKRRRSRRPAASGPRR
jgi:hypothetical protein